MRIHNKLLFLILLFVCGYSLFPSICLGHEPWLLSPGEVDSLNAKPKSLEFTQITWVNSLLCLMTLGGMAVWIYLDKKIDRWFFPLQTQLYSYHKWSALFLRYGTAAMLIISAFGLIPRDGYSYFTPSLFTPDLILNSSESLLKWLQVIIAIAFLLGIYVRFFALILLTLSIVAFILFGIKFVPYSGFYLGISIYLMLEGAQIFYLHVPTFFKINLVQWSDKHTQWAQLILQILTGLSFIFSSLIKFLYSNLTLGLLVKSSAFTFGIPYGAFVFLMAVIEMASGILIISGAMLRVLAIVLFILFTFLSINVNENILAHIFIYGILLAFILNGNGWQRYQKLTIY